MAQKNPLGPTGLTVQRNVKRLREQQNLSLAEVSRRLDKIGRKIPVLGLSRIEAGERRVDADDLVALAAVLRVSVPALLLPHQNPGGPVPLASRMSVDWRTAWNWMRGETALAASREWVALLPWRETNQPYLSAEKAAKRTFTTAIQAPTEFSVEALQEEADDG